MLPFLTPELISLVGGASMGFIMKLVGLSAERRQQQFEMMVKTIQAKDESADKAVARVPLDAGKWTRRIIVMFVLFGVILAPFIMALLGYPIVVQIDGKVKEWLFGVFTTGGRTHFVEIYGFLMIPELRQSLIAIVSFYFGSSAAGGKS